MSCGVGEINPHPSHCTDNASRRFLPSLNLEVFGHEHDSELLLKTVDHHVNTVLHFNLKLGDVTKAAGKAGLLVTRLAPSLIGRTESRDLQLCDFHDFGRPPHLKIGANFV